MAQFSYPWTAAPRAVATDTAIYAATFPNAVLDGLTVTRDGANAIVAAGVAVVAGRKYYNDTTVSLTPTNGVYSTIVLRMTSANNEVILVSKDGNSSAPPTLTQTSTVYELPLYNVNALGSPFTLTDVRPMYDNPGVVDDTGWEDCTFLNGVTGTAQVRRIGKQVWFRGSTSNNVSKSSVVILNVPAGFRPPNGIAGAVTFRGEGNSAMAGGISAGGDLGARNLDTENRTVLAMTATYLVD